MALKLGELLVARGLITPLQLEQALQAQQWFGGKLGTNLVEMGFISEDAVALCLSQQFGTPVIRPEAVSSIPREVIARVPKDLAQKYRALPLRLDGRTLHVCVADPHDLQRLDELSFALNSPVKPYVITELTLNYALERYYGIQREVRCLRLAGADPSQMRLTTTAEMVSIDELQSTARTPTPVAGVRVNDIATQLSNVMTEPETMELIFQHFSNLFDEVVLLRVAGEWARGALAGNRRNGKPRPVNTINIPLTDSPVLRDATTKAHIAFRHSANDPGLHRVCATVGIPVSFLTTVPIFEDRVPAFVVVGQGRDEVALKAIVPDLVSFIGRVSCALQIVRLRREILQPSA